MNPTRLSGITVMLVLGLVTAELSVKAAEPSFELTARYILEVVKAFRTAYVLKVVEHAKDGGCNTKRKLAEGFAFYSAAGTIC